MTDSVNQAVLKAHRTRVAEAKNFQEFQEAQLDLLDFMITASEREEVIQQALDNYSVKYNEWATR